MALVNSTATLHGNRVQDNVAGTAAGYVGAGGTLVTGTINVYDAPAFVDRLSGDYHLSSSSAARDRGLDAGVPNDIDGQPRPYQAPDLGADEYWPSGPLHIYLPQILKHAP